MANTISRFKKYIAALDEVYKLSALTEMPYLDFFIAIRTPHSKSPPLKLPTGLSAVFCGKEHSLTLYPKTICESC